MAATFNESQKIDYLWKKVGYAVTKTAESTVKEAFNESIPSPLLYRGDLVWMQSDQITGNPPAATTSIIQVYKDGVGSFSPSVECTEDLTSPDNQTWKTNSINWVPTQFGDNYLVQVYVANTGVTNPQTSGTKLFQAGSGRDDTWFFDYQSGVLNFNGANVPSQIASPITGKSVYIVGYRYVGLIGVTNQPSGNISGNTNIGNLNFTDTTISTITTNSNIYLTPNGVGNVQVTSSLIANGNLTVNSVSNLGNVGNIKITGGTSGYLLVTDGTGNLSWQAPASGSGIANGNSNVNIPTANGNINLTATGNTTLVVTGTGVNVAGYLTVTGTLTAGNINANVSSNVVDANSANISGNLYVADTATIGNVRTNNILYANGQPWDLQEAAGSNTQIQYNDGNTNFGASANFTFNQTTNLLTVVGNSQFNNANLGNLATANFVNVSSNLVVTNTANIGNVRTNNLLYANGSAWDFGGTPGGSNTQIQFNDSNEFGGSANFTFDNTTNLLTVVGTANVTTLNAIGNVTGNTGIFGNITTSGPSGDITGANVISTVTLTASGNITAANANLGNLAIANFVNVSSNLSVTNTANVGNLRTNNLLYANGSAYIFTTNAAGNTTQVQFNNSNAFTASANFTFDDATQLLTVIGNTQFNNANLGNLATANFVNVSSNLSVTNTANVGNLRTNNLLYANGSAWDLGGNPGGSNTQIQFNDSNEFGGSANFTFNQTTNLLTVVGNANIANINVSGTINANGNITGGNITTTGNGVFNNISTIGPSGDITGANVISTVILNASGNITSANANLGNLATANFVNVSSNLSVTNTATVGNLRTNNLLYANGSPWDLQEAAGSNTQIQYNDGNTNFGASANFTFNDSTQLLTVIGNSQFNNANLGNLATANFVNVSSNLSVINTANVGNLRTNNLLYANGSAWDLGGTPGGSNTQIQFNDSNEFGGSANFTFDKTTSLLSVVGNANIANINVSGNVTGNNGIFGNLFTTGPSGDITGVNLISTVTLTASGNITSANANLGNTSIANNVVANTFRMGVGVNEFYQSTVYFATTNSTAPNQLLWSTSLANLSAIDFTIISTDVTGNTRQTAKIAAAVLGTEVVFNEYSGLYINGGVGSFSVNYQAGSPDTIQLVVTPDSTNLTKYNLMIIQYAK